MIDKNKKDFIVNISETAERLYIKSVEEINIEFFEELPNIAEGLLKIVLSGLKDFHELEKLSIVDFVQYIYLSFLRINITTGYLEYRLDFYDNKDRVSLIECYKNWEFYFIFNHYNNIYQVLKNIFDKQTKVLGYELDGILYGLAEKYRKIADKKIEFVLKYILERDDKQVFAEKCIKFYRGEFMDAAHYMFLWEYGNINMNEQ